MTTTEAWRAVYDLAVRWRTSPVVVAFRSEFPQNDPQREPMPCMIELAKTGDSHSHPVQIYRAIPYMAYPFDLRAQMFCAAAERVSRSVSMVTAWLRSRLPGYPDLHAPQLAAGSYYTMQDNNFDVPWFPEAMNAGLENDPGPRQVNTELAIRGHKPSRKLAGAMLETGAWQDFRSVAESLGTTDIAQLLDAKESLALRLQTENREGIEYDDPRNKLQRRKALTDSFVSQLSGTAAQYAQAFETINDDINFVATHVFSQLIAFGLPRNMGETSDLEIVDRKLDDVRFRTQDLLRVGRLYWSSDPLVLDAIHVTSVGFADSAVHGSTIKCAGKTLRGSAQAWR